MLRLQVSGFIGFRTSSGFQEVKGVRHKVSGHVGQVAAWSGFRVSGLGLRVWGLGFRVLASRGETSDLHLCTAQFALGKGWFSVALFPRGLPSCQTRE